MSQLLSLCLTAAALVGNACAYGPVGHQTIGTIAEHYLADTRALKEVRALLKSGEGLDKAATWADRAKFPDKYLTAEMKTYVASHPDHQLYHYCDIPFQQKAYREGITGTHQRDIVHVLEICIQILQSPEDNCQNPLKIHKRLALMLIVHGIGDLHQPLHVGCGYLDAMDHFVDPQAGTQAQPDAGGNYLHLKTRSGTPLHGYWDTPSVKLARDHLGTDDFPTAVMNAFPARPDWDAKGRIGSWPHQWATDTLRLAESCYAGLIPHGRFHVPKNDKDEEHDEWIVTLPADYPVRARDTIEQQLSKAGYRLAALLKAIWP
jgi:hypothetical protein